MYRPRFMHTQTWLILIVIAVVAASLVTLLWDRFFSSEARYQRRRNRNHRPVRDRRQIPAVQLNVKVKKLNGRK